MNLALVFSGQGTQHAAMFSWLRDDDDVIRAMCRRLRVTDWRSEAAVAAWAEKNENAQLLVTGLALTAWSQLAPLLPAPLALAGYSVGEVAAFCAAGIYDAPTALELAHVRAAAMDRSASEMPGGLLAVSGVPSREVRALCSHAGLSIAICNGGLNVVIGGPLDSIEEVATQLAARGARCTPLRVGVASHTPLMQPAADEFAQSLRDFTWQSPRIPLFSNAADRVHSASEARHALIAQISTTVRWNECMEDLHARNLDCVLEIGAGQALARMWNARYPDVPARSCDEFRSATAIAQWVNERAG